MIRIKLICLSLGVVSILSAWEETIDTDLSEIDAYASDYFVDSPVDWPNDSSNSIDTYTGIQLVSAH